MNGYCSCTQDTKERYWEQQFCQMQKGHEAIVVYQTNPVEVEPFSYEKTFFCSNKIV